VKCSKQGAVALKVTFDIFHLSYYWFSGADIVVVVVNASVEVSAPLHKSNTPPLHNINVSNTIASAIFLSCF
jgi:hypothetical protein